MVDSEDRDLGGLTHEIAMKECKKSLNIVSGIAAGSIAFSAMLIGTIAHAPEDYDIAGYVIFGLGVGFSSYLTKGAVQDCFTILRGMKEDPIQFIHYHYKGVAERYEND